MYFLYLLQGGSLACYFTIRSVALPALLALDSEKLMTRDKFPILNEPSKVTDYETVGESWMQLLPYKLCV